jgi:hypothetical protein
MKNYEDTIADAGLIVVGIFIDRQDESLWELLGEMTAHAVTLRGGRHGELFDATIWAAVVADVISAAIGRLKKEFMTPAEIERAAPVFDEIAARVGVKH